MASARLSPRGAAPHAIQASRTGEDDEQPGAHGQDRCREMPIESALGQSAGDKRRERIAHEIPARGSEETAEPWRQDR